MPAEPLTVTLRLFTVLREHAGVERLSVTLDSTSPDVAAALARLAATHPATAAILPRCATAVGDAYVGRNHPLADGDEVAIIPPVSGG